MKTINRSQVVACLLGCVATALCSTQLDAAILGAHFGAQIATRGPSNAYDPNLFFSAATVGSPLSYSASGSLGGSHSVDAAAFAGPGGVSPSGITLLGALAESYSTGSGSLFVEGTSAHSVAVFQDVMLSPDAGARTFTFQVHTVLGNDVSSPPLLLAGLVFSAGPGSFASESELLPVMGSFFSSTSVWGPSVFPMSAWAETRFDGFTTGAGSGWDSAQPTASATAIDFVGQKTITVPYNPDLGGYSYFVLLSTSTSSIGGTAIVDATNTLSLVSIANSDGSPVDLSTARFDSGIEIPLQNGDVPEPATLASWSVLTLLGLVVRRNRHRTAGV